MFSYKQINGNTWTPITDPGQSGVICFDSATKENTPIRIYHTRGSMEGIESSKGLRLFPRTFNNDFLTISADGHDDVFYAICANPNCTADLAVDVF
jgi:hypothetical protein